MNDLSKYTKALKPLLPCSRKTKQQLLQQFHASVEAAWDSDGIPSMDFLVESFGPPEEMAAVLTESIPPEEITRYQMHRTFSKIFAIALLICLLLFSMYTFFWKQKPLVGVTDVNVIDVVENNSTGVDE